MKNIEIYTSPTCGYCHAAKRLLAAKGVSYSEFDIRREPQLRQEMIQRSNGRYTVPQIFVGDVHVGGFDDLRALEMSGKLDPILAA